MYHARRQTGRTTRMVLEALRIAAAEHPREVLIVVYTRNEVGRIRQLLREHGGPIADEVKVEPIEGANLEWLTLQARGTNALVLVDHYAIECRFKALLDMLHRFDR